MPKFNFNPAKVQLARDTLAEASELAEQIYTHIRVMTKSHGEEHNKNRSEALEKTETLYGLLGGK